MFKYNINENKNFDVNTNYLFFIPIGGTDEIGLNFNVIGYENELILIDCGVSFYDKYGIDIITSDPSFIVKNKEKIKALIITHAHEDHIGAVSYIWPLIKCPIYLSNFSNLVLKQKLKEKSWRSKVNINVFDFNKEYKIGSSIVEFISSSHSIPDPAFVSIKTKYGTVIHGGDWKDEKEPIINNVIDFDELKKIGNDGVLAFLSDSTNIFTEENKLSEKKIKNNFDNIFKNNKNKRIFVSCFSSNIVRVRSLIEVAKLNNRKVCIFGTSLERMIKAGEEANYIEKTEFISGKEISSVKPENLLIICTGSQGENNAALIKIAEKRNKLVSFGENDLILFSSRVIPGNEKNITNLQNVLLKTGADIITSSEEDIHVSGHPSCEDILKMYKTLRPKIVVPVHGDVRHIVAQTHFAKKNGIKHSVSLHNGLVLKLDENNPEVIGNVGTNKWAVDGKRMISFDGKIIKERKTLSESGFVSVVINFEKKVKNIIIKIYGLFDNKNQESEIIKKIKDEISDFCYENMNMKKVKENEDSIGVIISKIFYSSIGKKPIINVVFV